MPGVTDLTHTLAPAIEAASVMDVMLQVAIHGRGSSAAHSREHAVSGHVDQAGAGLLGDLGQLVGKKSIGPDYLSVALQRALRNGSGRVDDPVHGPYVECRREWLASSVHEPPRPRARLGRAHAPGIAVGGIDLEVLVLAQDADQSGSKHAAAADYEDLLHLKTSSPRNSAGSRSKCSFSSSRT